MEFKKDQKYWSFLLRNSLSIFSLQGKKVYSFRSYYVKLQAPARS